MPRKRMIDPDIWDSLQFSSLPVYGRLLFIGMFSLADDEGRLRANPGYLKKAIFGYDIDITPSNVAEWELAIIKSDLVKAYRNGHESYILVTNFPKYQKINHPTASKLPKQPQKDNEYITTIEQLTDGYIKTTVALTDTVDILQKHHIINNKVDSNINKSSNNTVALHDESSSTHSQYSIDKVSLISIDTLSKDKAVENNLYKKYQELLKDSKNDSKKIGTLIDAFKELHSDAPQIDFENIGGRIGILFKKVNRDAGYLLQIMWNAVSISISGSHISYIQNTIKNKQKYDKGKSIQSHMPKKRITPAEAKAEEERIYGKQAETCN